MLNPLPLNEKKQMLWGELFSWKEDNHWDKNNDNDDDEIKKLKRKTMKTLLKLMDKHDKEQGLLVSKFEDNSGIIGFVVQSLTNDLVFTVIENDVTKRSINITYSCKYISHEVL